MYYVVGTCNACFSFLSFLIIILWCCRKNLWGKAIEILEDQENDHWRRSFSSLSILTVKDTNCTSWWWDKNMTGEVSSCMHSSLQLLVQVLYQLPPEFCDGTLGEDWKNYFLYCRCYRTRWQLVVFVGYDTLSSSFVTTIEYRFNIRVGWRTSRESQTTFWVRGVESTHSFLGRYPVSRRSHELYPYRPFLFQKREGREENQSSSRLEGGSDRY